MKKKELIKHFEEKYLKNTCFPTLKELQADRKSYQVNAVRAFIAIELKGVWRGLQELLA